MKIYFFSGLILFLLVVIVNDSYIMNGLSVALLISFFVYISLKFNEFSSLSLYFFYAYLTTSIISYFTEFGGYYTEIHEISYLTGATARNSILAFFTLYFANISFSWINKSRLRFNNFIQPISTIENKIIILVYLLILFSLFYISIVYGRPNDYGYDRFDYWSKIAPGWGVGVKRLAEFWMIFLGKNYMQTKKKIYICLFIMGMLVFYALGDKFTSFINSIILFMIPIMLLAKKNVFSFLFSIKVLMILFIVALTIFALTFLSYYYIYGDASTAIEMVYVRISLQSQMWWGLDKVSDNLPKDINDIYDHFLNFLGNPENIGIYYLMQKIMPSSLYYAMLDNGVTLTMAYPVNIIYFFGYFLSFFIVTIFGIFLGLILGLISKIIKSGGGILLILSSLIYSILAQVYFMGCTYYLLSIRFLFALFVIVLIALLSMKSNKYKQ